MPEPLRPDDAHATAVSTVSEWGQLAAQASSEATDAATVLAVSSGRLAAIVAKQLAQHPPMWLEGRYACPSCVEIHGAVVVRAAYPCQTVSGIMEETLGLTCAAPEGMQMVVQDGAEPYLSLAVAELERMHNVHPDQARPYASTVLSAVVRAIRHR